MTDLTDIYQFLAVRTSESWINKALENQDILLIDHAHCEKKAAATALNLLFRYVDKSGLLHKMSRLAREELRHFERVLSIMTERDISYQHLSPARYAAGLREHIRDSEPHRLVDTLIVGAFIEARSCERFAALAPHLDDDLSGFYLGLLRSEARHYQDYLGLAQSYSEDEVTSRVSHFAAIEAELIDTPDSEFRFHSGRPVD